MLLARRPVYGDESKHYAYADSVAQRNTTADRVEQLVMPVDKLRKRELLSEQIGKGNWRQVLVFTCKLREGSYVLVCTGILG